MESLQFQSPQPHQTSSPPPQQAYRQAFDYNPDPYATSSLIFDNNNKNNLHGMIVSMLSELLRNMSLSEYFLGNATSSPFDFDYSHAFDLPFMPDVHNATLTMFSDTLHKLEEQYAQEQYGNLLRSYLTVTLTFVAIWALNKHTMKSAFLTHVLETLTSFLIFLPLLPGLLVFFSLLVFLRGAISLYFLLTSRGRYTLLNPVDGFWAYDKFANVSTCIGVYIIEGKCDPQVVRENMWNTVKCDLVGGKLSMKLVRKFGFACWEKVDQSTMNMERHVQVRFGDRKRTGDKEIFTVCKDIQDKPLLDIPPWELYVIPNYRYEGKEGVEYYAVIYRMHHSIMDGVSSCNILHSVMADKPFKFSVDPLLPLGHKNPSAFQQALMYGLGFISIPRVAIRNVFLTDNWQNKYYLPGKELTGPKTFAWSKPIDLGKIKEIKNATKTSVYSVLLSCLGGAFRQFYIKNGKTPESEYFHSMSPVALLPYPDRKPRNRFTGIVVPTRVGGSDEELRHLTPIDKLKQNYELLTDLGSTSTTFLAIANWYYPCILGLLPLFMHRPMCLSLHIRMTLSNVPGPAEDVHIYNGKMVDCAVFLPIKYTLAFGMGLFSYKDRVRAAVIGDHVYYDDSDVDYITKAFEKELTLLGQQLGINSVFCDE